MKTLLILISFFSFYYVFGEFPINTGTPNIEWFGQRVINTDNNLLIAGSSNYIGKRTSDDTI